MTEHKRPMTLRECMEAEDGVQPSDCSDLLCPKIFTDGGPWAKHNMPCAVYYENNRAILALGENVFLPSWEAQADGYMLIRPPKWLRKLLKRYVPK